MEDSPVGSPEKKPEHLIRELSLRASTHETRSRFSERETAVTPSGGGPMQRKAQRSDSVPMGSADDALLKTTLSVNCPEKIVLCLDLSQEVEDTKFVLGNGQTYTGVQMVKRTLEIFVQTKHAMDSRHEFALVVLNDVAVWLTNFTQNPKEICDVLKDLNETLYFETCDLSTLFTSTLEKTDLPDVSQPALIPPPFVVRAIVIYGRSHIIPKINEKCPDLLKLQASNYFFLDLIYIHQPPSEDNKCLTIFETLCDLDVKYTSYVQELSRSATKLHNQVATLLGHPLQRPVQSQASCKIST